MSTINNTLSKRYQTLKLYPIAFLILSILLPQTKILATIYTIQDQSDLVGQIQYHKVGTQDTWFRIAYHYDVGYDELRASNPTVDNLNLIKGQLVIIPSQHILPPKHIRRGIVVNISEKRLYYFIDANTVVTYPVGVGREGWKTPSFSGRVIRKDVAPTWYVPKSILEHYKKTKGIDHPKTVPPGPNNPLGNFVVRLNVPGILIHGTNRDSSIGKNISSGCIRMYNRNMTEFYHLLLGNPRVTFTAEDEKIGLDGQDIYYEKNPSYQVEDYSILNDLLQQLITEDLMLFLDKSIIHDTYHSNLGIPTKIGYRTSHASSKLNTSTAAMNGQVISNHYLAQSPHMDDYNM